MVAQHDEGGDDGQILAYARFRARDLGDSRVLADDRLDLLRGDAVPERLHEVVGAAVVGDVAVRVHGAYVAADEPLPAQHLALLVGPLPVAEHEGRVRAVRGQEPVLARRQWVGSPF